MEPLASNLISDMGFGESRTPATTVTTDDPPMGRRLTRENTQVYDDAQGVSDTVMVFLDNALVLNYYR